MSQPYGSTPLQVLTPELRAVLTNRIDRFLLNIIRANSDTQYASKAPCLAAFRRAVLAHGTEDTATLLQDFREHVPVTHYDSYRPWVARFNEHPCRESRVENLFAPGLPSYLAVSSSTSGKEPKLFASYKHVSYDGPPRRQFFDFSDAQGPTACIFHYGYRDLIEVERELGQVPKRIPFCLGSAGALRLRYGWDVESDETRMSTILPGQVAPWGANLIVNHRSYLMIHALFCLACRDLDQIFVTFIPYFIDLVRHIEEEWDTLVACIRDGTIPELDGIADLRAHCQAPFQSNPERAEELCKIGPPSSRDGWAAQIWPRLRRFGAICSGPFRTSVPQTRTILGPRIAIRNHGYVSSESIMSVFFDPEDIDTFVFETYDVLEFMDEDADALSGKVLQAWDLEAGKRYQIVLTTRNGLWRYPMDDVIEIVGFAPQGGSPVFEYYGRTLSEISLNAIAISSEKLLAAAQKINSLDLIQFLEFTTMRDEGVSPATVGFFFELAGLPGPNSHLTAQRLSDALGTVHDEYPLLFATHQISLPTIRLVKPGTFFQYRRWRCEKMNIGLGQMKVPVVLSHSESQEWFLERVTQEL